MIAGRPHVHVWAREQKMSKKPLRLYAYAKAESAYMYMYRTMYSVSAASSNYVHPVTLVATRRLLTEKTSQRFLVYRARPHSSAPDYGTQATLRDVIIAKGFETYFGMDQPAIKKAFELRTISIAAAVIKTSLRYILSFSARLSVV